MGGAVGKTSLRASFIAAALLLVSAAAQAAGLGKLTVLSHLGEPLRAEIDVVAVEKGELDTLNAKLASPDAYIQSNLPYPSPALGMKLAVDKRASGAPYIIVTSAQAIPEPFVDLLVELTWQGGKILRAYTALLDPPAFAAAPQPSPAPQAAAPVAPAPVAPPPERNIETQLGSEMQQPKAEQPPAETTAEAAPVPLAPPAEVPPPTDIAPTPQKKAAPAKETAKEDSYGPVKRGDTLSKIAKEYKADDVTLEQMLVLLYRNNKDAFVSKNMNRLRTGKVLSIPDPSEASSISAKEARKEVRAQVADFNAYRERLAAAAGGAVPESPSQAAAGRITGPVTEKGAVPGGEPKEVLKLSKGEAPGASKALQETVRNLEEELAARDRTIKEANERVARLEKTVKDMEGLLKLKNKGMAEATTPPPTPAPPQAMTPAAKPEVIMPKPATPAPATPAMPPPPMPAPQPSEMAKPGTAITPPAPAIPPAPMTGPMASSGTQPQPNIVAPKPRPKPKIVAPPPAPPSLFDQVLDEPVYLGAGVLVIALLAFLAFRMVRSRRTDDYGDIAAEKKTSDVGAFAATGTDGTGAMAAAARAAQQAQIAEEVDPLAEAEIYLAYGRDGQAEEILKEALQNQPRRHEIHLKLLEIYAKRKDVASFDPIARELQQSTGSKGEIWQQATRLGYQIDPANPRYLAGKPSGAEVAAAAAAAAVATGGDKTLDFQIDALEPAAEIGTLTDIDAGFGRRFATGAASANERLDFNVSQEDERSVGTKTDIDLSRLSTQVNAGAIDVDLDSLGGERSAVPDIDLGADRTTQIAPMDFQLDLPDSEDKTESQFAKADSVDFDLKLDDFGGGPGSPMTSSTGVDFDIDQISMESSPVGKSEPVLDLGQTAPPIPEIDLSSISLDLGGDHTATGGAHDEKWYDVQTKFDLAKAYQEMGDKEGAREILREVIAEGDGEQKSAAEKVLETL
jgi:pilus assembly protein FimV